MIKLISNLDGGTTCTATGSGDIPANASFNLMLLTNLRTLKKGWNARQDATQQAMKTLAFPQSSCVFHLKTAVTKVAAQT